jgi:hypothetical protein
VTNPQHPCLSDRDRDAFVDAMAADPTPNAVLLAAAERHREQVRRDYRPDDPDGEVYHGIQAAAWMDCIDFASRDPGFQLVYARETGGIAPGATVKASPLARMIDDATGRTDPERFAAWVSIRLYGLAFTPEKFQARVREMHAAGLLPWWDGVDNSTAEAES